MNETGESPQQPITGSSFSLEEKINETARAMRLGQDPESQKIDNAAKTIREEQGQQAQPTEAETLSENLAEEILRGEEYRRRLEAAEAELGARAIIAEKQQREIEAARAAAEAARIALEEERNARLAAEKRAAAAETELRSLRAQEKKSTVDSDDPHGYYGKLGITREDFKGLTPEQIVKALNNLIRANNILLSPDLRSDLTEGERIVLEKRLQERNEAAENLKQSGYRQPVH